MITYNEFLNKKVTIAKNSGFEIDHSEINQLLLPRLGRKEYRIPYPF